MSTALVIALISVGVLLLLWVLINARTSRPDGALERVHPYREMMAYIMPTRAESVVFFDVHVPADALLSYVREAREHFPCDITHCLVAACAIALHHPDGARMNRFVVGRRVYRRKGVWLSFSMKRKKLDRAAKLAVVKEQARGEDTFRGLCERIHGKIDVERSERKTYADKEFDLFLKLPRAVLDRSYRLLRWLDYHNCLPASFIENDALFTSVFVANLGSLGMDAGYHHLYEWGNCPLFVTAGAIADRPVVEVGDDGESEIAVRKTLHLRITYDERIDDGLSARFGIAVLRAVLENPREYLGCLAADGSDARPLRRSEPDSAS